MPFDYEQLGRLVLAVVLGAVIGFERELHMKPAGLRTNILICLGATIFTILSREMAIATGGDQTRIAAQIVTGLGFIGAGAILRGDRAVHGVTTAATIWLVAGIGMSCGAGYYELAIVATVVTVCVLMGLTPIDKYLARRRKLVEKAPSDSDNL